MGDDVMNFCVECGFALEGSKEECLNCGFKVDDFNKKQSTLDRTVPIKLATLSYEGIVNLISLIQMNFYLSFISTFILFIIFSTKPILGWGIFLILLILGYFYANSKEVTQHRLDYTIQLWFASKVKITPEKLEDFKKNTQGFIQTIKSKNETMPKPIVTTEAPTVVVENDDTAQEVEADLNVTDPVETVTQPPIKQGGTNHLTTNAIVKYVVQILLIAIALFIYYRGMVAYSLYDINVSFLSESYQQRTLTMSYLIELLSYGHYFDNSARAEITYMVFNIIAYYLPFGFAFLALLPSRLAGFYQLVIGLIMGGGMVYLVNVVGNSNLLVNYVGEYGSFSAGLGLGSYFIFGAIIFMIILSLNKMLSRMPVVRIER